MRNGIDGVPGLATGSTSRLPHVVVALLVRMVLRRDDFVCLPPIVSLGILLSCRFIRFGTAEYIYYTTYPALPSHCGRARELPLPTVFL